MQHNLIVVINKVTQIVKSTYVLAIFEAPRFNGMEEFNHLPDLGILLLTVCFLFLE